MGHDKDKKKKRKFTEDSHLLQDHVADDNTHVEVSQSNLDGKKMKKKKKSLAEADVDVNIEKKKKKKKKHKEIEEENSLVDAASGTKKRKMNEKQIDNETDSLDESSCKRKEMENVERKKKRKDKEKLPTEEDSNEPARSEMNSNNIQGKMKKKKKTGKTNDIVAENGHVKEENAVPKSNLGQWSTADLGDENRQNKFYQLLGGFKKSGDDIKKPINSFASKFNSALNKNGEADLNSKLQKQFETARFNTLNARGIGLGFGSEKKNAIDTSCRSKKFDDSDTE